MKRGAVGSDKEGAALFHHGRPSGFRLGFAAPESPRGEAFSVAAHFSPPLPTAHSLLPSASQ